MNAIDVLFNRDQSKSPEGEMFDDCYARLSFHAAFLSDPPLSYLITTI